MPFRNPADNAAASSAAAVVAGLFSPDDRHRLEHHGSHEWQGETLIEHSKWKIRGITLTFERHLTFSADGKELHIRERVAGPQGQKQADFTLPLS